MDTNARQLALDNLKAANQSKTESVALLNAAQAAAKTAVLNQDSAMAGRAQMLASSAYKARMNSEVGRFRAAFALLAAKQGDQVQSTQAVADKAESAARQKPLIESVQHATRRRNLLLQAGEQSAKLLDNLPGLPPWLVGMRSVGADQVTMNRVVGVGMRTQDYVERTSMFFPRDIRVAAAVSAGGQIRGLDDLGDLDGASWFGAVCKCMEHDVAQLQGLMSAEADKLLGQDPAAAAIGQQAIALHNRLHAMGSGEGGSLHGLGAADDTSSTTKLIIVGVGLAAAVYLLKKRKN
jgi:hypothetical protein